MPSKYCFEYTDEKTYRTIQVYDDGYIRVIPNDSHDLADWIAAGNKPEVRIAAEAKLLSIVDGAVVVDTGKSAAELIEKEERKKIEEEGAAVLAANIAAFDSSATIDDLKAAIRPLLFPGS